MATNVNQTGLQLLPSNYVWLGNGTTNPTPTLSTSGFAAINVQTFSTVGAFTYVPTTGTTYAIFEMVGGGGGGGGTSSTIGGGLSVAGSGGAAAYIKLFVTGPVNLAGIIGSVGAGGTAAPAGGSGGTGGQTTLLINSGVTWIANGGGGGTGGALTASGSVGSAHGAHGAAVTGTNGTLMIVVAPASVPTYGLGISATVTFGYALGSIGGNTPLGAGGNAVFLIEAATPVLGSAGSGYGSGAAGSIAGPSQTQIGGTAGQPGVVIVTEYII